MSDNSRFTMHFRPAKASDASSIAAIHTRSWQLHYRGAMSDQYPNHEASAERDRFWTVRLTDHQGQIQTIVAYNSKQLTGFCCLEPDIHPKDGYYLDNLHVIPEATGKGIGKSLMQKSAALLLQERPDGRIYLWVLADNTDAISFYYHLDARQGRSGILSLAGNKVEALMMWWPLSEMAGWE
jgi:ribosomal protein S18 acetylase RimI-like enzyme